MLSAKLIILLLVTAIMIKGTTSRCYETSDCHTCCHSNYHDDPQLCAECLKACENKGDVNAFLDLIGQTVFIAKFSAIQDHGDGASINDYIGWSFWVTFAACVLALACANVMIFSRRFRRQTSADDVRGTLPYGDVTRPYGNVTATVPDLPPPYTVCGNVPGDGSTQQFASSLNCRQNNIMGPDSLNSTRQHSVSSSSSTSGLMHGSWNGDVFCFDNRFAKDEPEGAALPQYSALYSQPVDTLKADYV